MLEPHSLLPISRFNCRKLVYITNHSKIISSLDCCRRPLAIASDYLLQIKRKEAETVAGLRSLEEQEVDKTRVAPSASFRETDDGRPSLHFAQDPIQSNLIPNP
jgi:hypothetical protein